MPSHEFSHSNISNFRHAKILNTHISDDILGFKHHISIHIAFILHFPSYCIQQFRTCNAQFHIRMLNVWMLKDFETYFCNFDERKFYIWIFHKVLDKCTYIFLYNPLKGTKSPSCYSALSRSCMYMRDIVDIVNEIVRVFV